MDGCIAIVSDMIFATRISGTAGKVGVACRVVRDAGSLRDALDASAPKTVLVDMECDGLPPDEAIRTVKTKCPSARVIAFFPHAQTELMEQAKAAGADDAWARSVFVHRLPEVLQEA